jgi:hypothetical protein
LVPIAHHNHERLITIEVVGLVSLRTGVRLEA